MRSLWNRLPLRTRLFSAVAILLALVLVISLSLQSSFHAGGRMESLMQRELPAQLSQLGDQVALRLLPSLEISKSLAFNSYIERWISAGMPADQLDQVQEEMSRVHQHLEAGIVFIAANDGEHIHYHHYQNGVLNHRPMRRDSADDGWYFRYLDSGALYELNLDTNAFSGEQLQMFVNYRGLNTGANDEPYSVAGVGIDMLHLAQLISDYRIADTGAASLVSREGVVEVPGSRARLTDLRDHPQLMQLLQRESAQVAEIQHQGQALLVGSIWVPDLQRFLLMEVPRDEFMGSIHQQFYTSLLIGVLLIVLSLVLLYPLTAGLTRPLSEFQQQLRRITASLDLRQRIQVRDEAEVGALAQDTNALLERLHAALAAVSGSSSRLARAAGELAHTAGLVGRNRDQQNVASQSMAAAVEEMSSSVAEITSTMEELSASSTQIADHSQSVVDVANLTLENSRKGVEAMQQLRANMADIHQDNQQSLQEIMELGAKSKQISQVMDLINTLADQTRLIAFNAALEASSAGESGKRFSVVAGEIRRLADSVTDSTREIEVRIQEIQDSISRLVLNSEKGASSIEAGMQVSAHTSEDLNALLQAATRTSTAAQQISLSTKQQKTASSQVVVALRDIANASTHNSDSVRQITDISEELVGMADELRDLVQAFQLLHAEQDVAQTAPREGSPS